jgi:peptidylprolyl isomerase
VSLALTAALLAASGAAAEGAPEPAAKPVRAATAARKPASPSPAERATAPLTAPLPEPVQVAPLVVRPRASIVVSVPTSPEDWRALDAQNTLLIETDKGRIVVELRPQFAPLAVARIKRLARSGVYDDLKFHRVVDGFVAQTGNPNNMDGGKSLEPDLPPEFTFRLGPDTPRAQLARPQGESEGFIGAQPYVAVDEIRMATSPDHRVSAWGAFCSGVVAMGRDTAPGSGNAGFFIMRGTTRSLDRQYSVVGRVIAGMDVVSALTAGDPPLQPSRMLRARVMADLPEPLRPQIAVLNTLSPEFHALAEQVRDVKGADFSICDVEAPVRITAPPAVTAEKPARKRQRRAENNGAPAA